MKSRFTFTGHPLGDIGDHSGSIVALMFEIGYNKKGAELISHWEWKRAFFKKHPVYLNQRGGVMVEHEKECQECGWRGLTAELDEANDDSSGQTQIFCPDCGGIDIQDLNLD